MSHLSSSMGMTGSRLHWKANMIGRSKVDIPNTISVIRLDLHKSGLHLNVYKAPTKVPTAIATGPAKPE